MPAVPKSHLHPSTVPQTVERYWIHGFATPTTPPKADLGEQESPVEPNDRWS